MRPLLTLLLAALLVPGSARAAAPVKLGIINSVTGPEAPIGENLTGGYKLAEEDLKARGTPVELVWEDDTGKPQIAMGAMEKLATRDRVAAVVGPYTSASSNATAKRAEQYKVPLVIPAASKEEITKQGLKWVFRVSATTDDYAAILLDMALSVGKPRTIAIVNENTDFGVSAAKSARALSEKRGLKVVAEEAYSKGSPDYRSTLTKVKSASPDLVFMVSYVADAILLMRQSREIGLSPQAFLGAGAGFATVQFASERDVSNGVFSSTQWTDDVKWPGAKAFFDRYKKRFGKEPTYHAACAYVSLLIAAEAASQAGGDREKTRAALDQGSWNGIMGQVKFVDGNGYTNQNRHPMLAEQVQQGRQVTVYPPDLASAKPIWPFPGWR
ncbi:ABC transporter substrate-binding protein [Anaeromyxobacter paludicola]|uniref:Branched-chain amino acid ABC transporter substrate-binding protein n=1 Tax=Anaeromyxobacter paludicola TaxID=2918171 RepID=A0ABN6NC79_9BACT|nr:ABC transporter substrate-binding protein [Anaeromyxobacter paludicola]BDG10686.1 branched-chain amino acid ABC transporter substrate-binding protein [Anaeromyxobacter paludicola]